MLFRSGSDRRYFPFENGRDEDAWPRSKKRARKALEEMGLLHAPPSGTLADVLGPHDPYDVQVKGTEIDGQLAIAESPTGSGKTELALGRFARLRREGKVDGLYFAVPTRSAAKQLHKRVSDAVEALFDDPPPVVQAVPGYVKADDQNGVRRGRDVYWEAEADRKRNWAAERSKRYLASAIAVGTIDQVLLAMLENPHAHLRAAGLLQSLLVVDEVHASSVYMNSVLERVLSQHIGAGGHALLMSATLGSESRSTFLDIPSPSLEDAVSEDYPYVATRTAEHSASLPGDPKTVEIDVRRVSDLNAGTVDAIEDHATRARVLAICNTVDRARSVQHALSCHTLTVEGRPVCHHSRYAQPDRDLLDEAVESVYGEGAPSGAIATVATQTVEQSLDIDSDFMVTDLCPMDVLLQRIGRLHRHRRPGMRPEGYDTPRCIVIAPDNRLESYLTDDGEAWGPMGVGTVYEDLRVLQATLEELEARDRIAIPDDNRPLVERTTHSDVLSSLEERSARWAAHGRHIRSQIASDEANSGLVSVDWNTPYSDQSFTKADVQTRLGDVDYTIELEARTPFGHDISELDLPAWMVESSVEKPVATLLKQEPDGFSFEVSGQTFQYTKDGFSRDSS